MRDQFPIKQIFQNGLKMPFEKHSELLRLGWPFALLILIYPFSLDAVEGAALNLFFLLAFCLAAVLALVGCHRVFLLPEDVVQETSTFRWSSRETKFLLCMLGISILAGIISIPAFFLISSFAGLAFFLDGSNEFAYAFLLTVAYLPIYYLVARWSLILPDSAIGNDRTLSWAWNASSGFSWGLFILIGALPLTTSFIFELLASFLDGSSILMVLQNAVWMVVAVIEVCMLSLSYEWIVSKQAPEGYS